MLQKLQFETPVVYAAKFWLFLFYGDNPICQTLPAVCQSFIAISKFKLLKMKIIFSSKV